MYSYLYLYPKTSDHQQYKKESGIKTTLKNSFQQIFRISVYPPISFASSCILHLFPHSSLLPTFFISSCILSSSRIFHFFPYLDLPVSFTSPRILHFFHYASHFPYPLLLAVACTTSPSLNSSFLIFHLILNFFEILNSNKNKLKIQASLMKGIVEL